MKYTIDEIRGFVDLMQVSGYDIWDLDIPEDLKEHIAASEIVEWSYCGKDGQIMINRSEAIELWCEDQVDVNAIACAGYDEYKREVHIRAMQFSGGVKHIYVDPSETREDTLYRSIFAIENRIKSLNSTLRTVRKTLKTLKAASKEAKE